MHVRRVRYAGISRYCPVCRSCLRKFLPHGVERREHAVCPVCFCRDRHRLAWLYFQRETGLFMRPAAFLHIAPEPSLAARLSALKHIEYLSVDLFHTAMIQMDICRMRLPDNTYDMVYCSHVLNMLPADRPAIAELYRVTKPGGMALIQVPKIIRGGPVELDERSTCDQRQEQLGDPHMYRRYDPNLLVQRLSADGFLVSRIPYYSSFAASDQRRYGLIDEDLYFCRKQG